MCCADHELLTELSLHLRDKVSLLYASEFLGMICCLLSAGFADNTLSLLSILLKSTSHVAYFLKLKETSLMLSHINKSIKGQNGQALGRI